MVYGAIKTCSTFELMHEAFKYIEEVDKMDTQKTLYGHRYEKLQEDISIKEMEQKFIHLVTNKKLIVTTQ